MTNTGTSFRVYLDNGESHAIAADDPTIAANAIRQRHSGAIVRKVKRIRD